MESVMTVVTIHTVVKLVDVQFARNYFQDFLKILSQFLVLNLFHSDYHCMPLCSAVEGWHCCLDSEGEPNCKRCCSDSDCPLGEECT